MNVTVRELKNSLSKYLKCARAGEHIVVYSRRKAVARLTPPAPSETATPEEAIERLKSLPWVRHGAGGRPKGLRKGVRLRGKGATAAEIVIRERE